MSASFSPKKIVRITTVPMALRYLLQGQMRFMADNGFEVLMISADGKELKEVLEIEQCSHIIVPMTRKITPLQDLKCLWQLIKILRENKPAIVHTHTPKAGLLGMLAARIARVPVRLHTVAGLPLMVETGVKYRVLRFVERLTYACATGVWPNSQSLYDYIADEKLVKRAKLKVIGKGSSNGIDLSRFNQHALQENILSEIKRQLEYDADHIYLLCIGRLVVDKGIVELVEVFAEIKKTHPAVKLILAGSFESDLDPLPEHTLLELKQNKDIIHVAWTNHVEYYLHLADFFVFPSHREGFPNVLLQAGAMDLPIICSRIAGNVDIVNDRQTGLIFEIGNREEMKLKILTALENPPQMKQMALKLKEEIQLNYKREQIWQNLLNEYESLINSIK